MARSLQEHDKQAVMSSGIVSEQDTVEEVEEIALPVLIYKAKINFSEESIIKDEFSSTVLEKRQKSLSYLSMERICIIKLFSHSQWCLQI
jgi:hypothetical protein